MSYRLVDRVPTPDEHRALAVSVGWGEAFRWDVGTRVTERLLDLVHEISGGDAFVGLFATAEAQPVYARLGFDGTSPVAGMWQMLRRRP